MATATHVDATPAGTRVASSDPATPAARVEDGRAHCECGGRIPLQETDGNGDPTGIEYQLHYYHEHTAPAIRYEETAT